MRFPIISPAGARLLPPLALSCREGCEKRDHLRLPSPKSVLRHACPVVLEAVLAPLALFYLVLVTAGFRGALVAALVWSYLAFGRRVRKGERVSTMLLLGVTLLTLRTVISFITGSSFLYFIQPTVTAVLIALVLIASAFVGRPFTERFAHDFCPIGPDLLARPSVRRFFVRVSILWATALLVNAGIVLWLLVSSSLRTFVVERTAITWGVTGIAIYLSITWFLAAMRRDGITVEWAREPRNEDAAALAPVLPTNGVSATDVGDYRCAEMSADQEILPVVHFNANPIEGPRACDLA
jgi:hypothetical protein